MEFLISSRDEFRKLQFHYSPDQCILPYIEDYYDNSIIIYSTIAEYFSIYSTTGEKTVVECSTPVCSAELLYVDGNWIIVSIGVRPDHQNRGISKLLISAIVKFLTENNVTTVVRTSPSWMGMLYSYDEMSKQLHKANINF